MIFFKENSGNAFIFLVVHSYISMHLSMNSGIRALLSSIKVLLVKGRPSSLSDYERKWREKM